MKYFLKAAASVAIILVVSLVIHILCNMYGISLNTTVTGTVSAICAVAIYHGLTRNDSERK